MSDRSSGTTVTGENGAITKHSDDDFRVEQKPFATSIPQQPVTEHRKPYKPAKEDMLQDAGTARANIAASREQPNGTTENDYAAKRQHRSVIQQHCDYWDPDGDGIIWPQDTYAGCRKWGEYLINQHFCARRSTDAHQVGILSSQR